MKKYIYLLLVLISFQGMSQTFNEEQQAYIDSLYLIVESPQSHDTSVAASYLALSGILYLESIDSLRTMCEKLVIYCNNAIEKSSSKAVKNSLLIAKSNAVNNIGVFYNATGDIPKSLIYFEKSLVIQEEIGDQESVALSLLNIGVTYKIQGDIPKAIDYFHRSLKIYEEIGFKQGMANSANNIGTIYHDQNDLEKALEFYFISLALSEELDNKKTIANSLNNIAVLYSLQGDNEKALEYHKRNLPIQEEIFEKRGLAISLHNIGNIYDGFEEYDRALEYYKRGLTINRELSYKSGVTSSLCSIGVTLWNKDDVKGAEKMGVESFELAEEIGDPKLINDAAKLLSDVYEKQGHGMKALNMYKLYTQMKDSIYNENTHQETARQQTKYEMEKAQIIKENEAEEKAKIEFETTQRRNNLQYSLIFLGILALFGIVLSFGFIKVSAGIANGLIFFVFLILFEFILVFTDPYLEQYTQDQPFYNLIANASLAILIFPLHSLLEKLLKNRLVKG